MYRVELNFYDLVPREVGCSRGCSKPYRTVSEGYGIYVVVIRYRMSTDRYGVQYSKAVAPVRTAGTALKHLKHMRDPHTNTRVTDRSD